MGLTLKHVERTKAGSWQYRRRVPKSVYSVISKREFKQKLGDTEREALAAWPRFHALVEQKIGAALKHIVQSHEVTLGNATDREAYIQAQKIVNEYISAGTTPEELEIAADILAATYPQDPETDAPIGASQVDVFTINIMRLGDERCKAPEATLADALTFYLNERKRDEAPDALSRFEGTVKRIVGHVATALGRDPVLIRMTREDARKVRDHMLDRVKSTGERVKAASVARDLNGLKAIINFAATEMPLPSSFKNPFNKLSVGIVHGRAADGELRNPLPAEVLSATRARILTNAKPELGLVWRILEGTGCRLSEVTGLRVEDVDILGELPNVRVTWHENRRIKTNASRRFVPLVGDALEAASEALKLHSSGNLLFPSYGRTRGGDAASAALMKHVRAVTTDPKLVVHSLRHNMKDRLLLAEVTSLDQNLILGHALGGVGDRVYGGDVAKLRVTTRAMKQALAINS